MTPLLFVNPCPLQNWKKPTKTSVRRPRTFACAQNPNEQDREIGEPSWMNLARNISSAGSDDPPRPPPKWEYPEGQPNATSDEENSAWRSWNDAVEKDVPFEERDVKAETDFWRTAAQEMADGVDDLPSTQPMSTAENDILTDEKPKSEDIWRMARGVTGEMSELQEKLRSELERYNPIENTDQYRDIARELVGPEEEPWENSDPVRSSEGGADAGMGWNPDVDWMRFDDVRREQVKSLEKASRLEAERAAREQMESLKGDETEAFSDVDDELSRTFTDQSVDESFIQQPPSGQLPGFLTSRMRRTSTYGAGWSGAEEEAEKLLEEGILLRDPKADTDKWRDAAKELGTEVGVVNEKSDSDEVEERKRGFELQSEAEKEVAEAAEALEDTKLEKENESEKKSSSNTQEESSWSSWRSSSAKWEAVNEEPEPRDPAREVDMWRSSARELTSDTPRSEELKSNPQLDMDGTDGKQQNAGSAWDQWRSANARWESSISDEPEVSSREPETTWGSSNQSDWGAGLGSKASSERSAWEQWSNVSGMSGNRNSSSWWNNRTSKSSETDGAPDRSFSNTDEWRSVAREALNLPEKDADQEATSRKERIERDTSLDSWRSIARDLVEEQD